MGQRDERVERIDPATIDWMRDYVGASGAARRLGCSAENVRRLHREGKLAAVESANGRLYAVADLDRLAAERAVSPLLRAHRSSVTTADDNTTTPAPRPTMRARDARRA